MLPHIGEIADWIAIVKSIHTDAFNHAPAQTFFRTGRQQLGKPPRLLREQPNSGSDESNCKQEVQ